jgi:hypothetical protein
VSFLEHPATMAFHLRGPNAELFTNLALPVVPPSLGGLSQNIFGVGATNEIFVVTGQLTSLSLIPEPATLVLLAGGSFTLVMRRRRLASISVARISEIEQ